MRIALVGSPVFSSFSPPPSLAVLQARLKKENHEVHVFELSAELRRRSRRWYAYLNKLGGLYRTEQAASFYPLFLLPRKHLQRQVGAILSSDADVFCFSVFKHNLPASLYQAALIKRRRPEATIIFGGQTCYYTHVKRFIETFGVVDHIIDTEGDLRLLNLLRELEGKGEREKIGLLDINEEPIPDFTGMDLDDYVFRQIPYSTTRGCYRKCDFCFDTVFWERFRAKRPEKVVVDLEELKERHGTGMFLFADSVMLGSRRYIERFCDLVIGKGLKISWGGQIRAEGLDKTLLAKMREAGCDYLAIGFESGSQRVLDRINKKESVRENERVIRDAHSAGLNVYGLFMVGHPVEGPQDFRKTLSFLWRNRKYLAGAYVSPTSLYEGTALYRDARRYGITNPDSFFWRSDTTTILTRMFRYWRFRLAARRQGKRKWEKIESERLPVVSRMVEFWKGLERKVAGKDPRNQ